MGRLIPVKAKDQTLYAQVDDEDFERLSKFKWYERNGYAFRYIYISEGKGRTEYMHRNVMKPEGKLRVDHIDHDRLNNQKVNLRSITHAQNLANHERSSGRGTSRFFGVAKHRVNKKGQAFIVQCGTNYVGIFYDEIEGAKAYDAKAVELYGECATLNFPTQGQASGGGGVSAVS
jgi:hypothetical protein